MSTPSVESACKRRKTSTTSIGRLSPTEKENWLNILPADMTRRITACLMSSHEAFVSLAETSPRLGYAAQAVVDEHFAIRNKELKKRWEAVLGAQNLYLSVERNRHAEERGRFAHLWKDEDWNAAHVDIGLENIVKFTKRGLIKSMTSLSWIKNGWVDTLVDFFAASGIRELSIRCQCVKNSSYGCFFMTMAKNRAFYSRSTHDCKVEKLELNCEASRTSTYGTTLSMFKNLRVVTLHGLGELNEEMMAMLKKMEAVHLLNLSRSEGRAALRIEEALITLSFEPGWWKFNHLTQSDISAFSKCSNLKSLTATVTNAAEGGLTKLPPTLEELRLDWSQYVRFSGQVYPQTTCPDERLCPIASYVQRAPNLSKLHLVGIIISLKDIAEILKATGVRLVEFRISIPFDNRLNTLQFIVQQMATFNTSLRVVDLHLAVRKLGEVSRSNNAATNIQTSEAGQKLLSTVNVLRRRAPMLDTRSLQEAIDWILPPLKLENELSGQETEQ